MRRYQPPQWLLVPEPFLDSGIGLRFRRKIARAVDDVLGKGVDLDILADDLVAFRGEFFTEGWTYEGICMDWQDALVSQYLPG